jgi:16S rRNA (adenine1518-N6/adenine1519-N6)-dimethyltransferase
MPKYITNTQQMRDLIRRHEFHVKKKLGQHFMVSSQVLERIIELAEVKTEDRVLEIGPGLGALTQHLAEKAGQVVAVEVDVSLFPLLRETLARFSNIRLVAGDILKLNLDEIMQQERLVKDGPTSPLTYKVAE